MMNQSDHHIR